MATQPVPERIVGEDYAAAILSQEHDCTVASEPVKVLPGTAVWKMRVRRPDGTDVTAYYNLALTGRKNSPETNRTTGTLIGKEHVASDRETGERKLKGSCSGLSRTGREGLFRRRSRTVSSTTPGGPMAKPIRLSSWGPSSSTWPALPRISWSAA
jgi:hypothetical protein